LRLASAIHDRFPALVGPRTVWTIGRIEIVPNAPSIIPGEAWMQVQFRDIDPAILSRLEETLYDLAQACDHAGPCRCEVSVMSKSLPAPMDPGFQAVIEKAAERRAPGAHMRLPSAAGHDAAVLSKKLRAAMLFVPSIGGISHHWSEDTKRADIVLGAEVFADAAYEILLQQ
jgi:N-carbamoyl-L-amino-acid hydrolase